MLSTRVSLSATLGSFPICSSVFRTPNCPALVRSFRTSRLRSRSHPLRQQQRPETNKALYSQKWSTRTLVLLATFVGAASYTLVQAQKHPALLDLDALRVPSPTQNDFDIAFTKVSAALPEDCVATDDVSLQACVAPWSYANAAALPGAVLYPRSTQDVQTIVKIANEHDIPLIPFSGLTSLEGHVHAPDFESGKAELSMRVAHDQLRRGRAWCISFSENMNNIVQLHQDDLDVVVQPGLPYEALNAELKRFQLFFPTDPGPGAQIGGMVGTGASGTNAVRYGTMRENVLYLTVVLADGSVVKTRQRAKKSSAGPNLGQLFIGAEGTLGIVTEVCLKLQPLLPSTVAVASFKDIQEAATCVRSIVQNGIQVQCVELMDDLMVKCTNEYAKSQPHMRQWPVQPALFFKFSGNEKQLANDVERTASVVRQFGGAELVFAQSDKESENLWYSRKVAFWSALDSRPGSSCIVTDVCVPISKLPEMVARLKKDLDDLGLEAPIVGHAGDGNIHALILVDSAQERQKGKQAVYSMIKTAQALDGTCTGEHGVGLGKKNSLPAELGPGTVALLRRIKASVDPKGIMNPLKLYPDSKYT